MPRSSSLGEHRGCLEIFRITGRIGQLVGMARSTCKGRRRPTLPTYAICSDDRDVELARDGEIEDVRVRRLQGLVQSPVDGECGVARGIGESARGRRPEQASRIIDGRAGWRQAGLARSSRSQACESAEHSPATRHQRDCRESVERPKEPFWSKLLTMGMPKWSYMML